MSYEDTPPSLADHLSLEQRVLDLENALKGVHLRLRDAENRLEAVDPGARSIDANAHMNPNGNFCGIMESCDRISRLGEELQRLRKEPLKVIRW